MGETASETRSGPRESTVSETVGESQVVPWDVNAVGGVSFCNKKIDLQIGGVIKLP